MNGLHDWVLVRGRFSYVPQVTFFARTGVCVVASGLGETEPTVGTASDGVGVVFVLAVVLPETDGADLELS
jgi:hypothetical protein